MYFVNSGSEANDLAMSMARMYTGNYDLLALRNCYHGASPSTMGLTAHSTWKYNTPQGFGVHHMMNPDPYRGMFGNDGKAYAADVKDFIMHGTSGPLPLPSPPSQRLPTPALPHLSLHGRGTDASAGVGRPCGRLLR